MFTFYYIFFSLRYGQYDSDNDPEEMSSICEEDIAHNETDLLDSNIMYHHQNNNHSETFKDLNNNIDYNHLDITDSLIHDGRYHNMHYNNNNNDRNESYNNSSILNNVNNNNLSNDFNKNYNDSINNSSNQSQVQARESNNNYNLNNSLYNYKRNCNENNYRKSLNMLSHQQSNLNNHVLVNSNREHSVSPTTVSSLSAAHLVGQFFLNYFPLIRRFLCHLVSSSSFHFRFNLIFSLFVISFYFISLITYFFSFFLQHLTNLSIFLRKRI